MQCEICHEQPATIHIHEQLNGTQRVIHICEDCARKKTDDIGLSIAGMICNAKEHLNTGTPPVVTVCPSCGWTLDRFRSAGRLGCATCWNTFRDVLDEGIPTVHRGTFHIGLQPKRDVPELSPASVVERNLETEIAALQQELDALVRKEAYEAAVVVRDRIAKLKKQLEEEEAE